MSGALEALALTGARTRGCLVAVVDLMNTQRRGATDKPAYSSPFPYVAPSVTR